MAKPATPAPKKPYSTPVLTVYGTVRELTKTVGNRRTKDGGQGRTSRTSLS
jgi:hypothetical protein